MVRETLIQSQIGSYKRLLKWYLIPPCLTLSNIRYISRVKWNNPRKGVALSPTPRCSSYRKESPLVALDYGHQLYLLILLRSCSLWRKCFSIRSNSLWFKNLILPIEMLISKLKGHPDFSINSSQQYVPF